MACTAFEQVHNQTLSLGSSRLKCKWKPACHMCKCLSIINQYSRPPDLRRMCSRTFLYDLYWYCSKLFDDSLPDIWAFIFEDSISDQYTAKCGAGVRKIPSI